MSEMNTERKITPGLITEAAIIAGLYVVLSLATYQFSYLEIQCRVAEALCMTVFFTPAGAFGVCIGCFITNLFGGSWIDMVFGTLATVIAVVLTLPITKYIKRKCGGVLDYKHSLLIPIPTVVVNAIIIPFVIAKTLELDTSIPLLMLSVGIGEVIACGILGTGLFYILKRYGFKLIPKSYR